MLSSSLGKHQFPNCIVYKVMKIEMMWLEHTYVDRFEQPKFFGFHKIPVSVASKATIAKAYRHSHVIQLKDMCYVMPSIWFALYHIYWACMSLTGHGKADDAYDGYCIFGIHVIPVANVQCEFVLKQRYAVDNIWKIRSNYVFCH